MQYIMIYIYFIFFNLKYQSIEIKKKKIKKKKKKKKKKINKKFLLIIFFIILFALKYKK